MKAIGIFGFSCDRLLEFVVVNAIAVLGIFMRSVFFGIWLQSLFGFCDCECDRLRLKLIICDRYFLGFGSDRFLNLIAIAFCFLCL
jgi:hypothetical protein